jgi:thiol-disulfide isomerase/thioredoxin
LAGENNGGGAVISCLFKNREDLIMASKYISCSQAKMITISFGMFFVFLSFPNSSQGTGQTDANTEKIREERLNSVRHLSKLGNAIDIYADSHEGNYPKKLEELESYSGIDFDWLIKNVCYIGANMTREAPLDKPIAYDKTMPSKGGMTVVLYNDKHLECVKLDKFLALETSQAYEEPNGGKQKKNTGPIVLKVVGPDGKALAGAKVYQNYYTSDGRQNGKEYICDGNGLVDLAEKEIFKYEWQKGEHYIGTVLYGLYNDKLAGFAVVKGNDLGKEVELKLTPVCRVHGRIKSADLNNLGQKVEWTNVYVTYFYNGCIYNQSLSCSSRQGMFEFLLPNNEYQLYAYGTRLYEKEKDIKVRFWQKEKKIDFDLPADRLAYLIGKQAPELQQIKGWINSKPIKLADLRGKVVLLDFWGTWCGPCVQVIPELIDLHEKYQDKGLVIIGIHTDSMNSVEDLEKEINKLSKERWDDRKIPFAIALDGGGKCKIERTKLTSNGATTAAYGIQGWPTIVLIDKQNKVVDQYDPGANTELLENLLAAEANNTPHRLIGIGGR